MVREGRRENERENGKGGGVRNRRRRRERSLSFSRSPSPHPPPQKRSYTHSRTNRKQSDRSRSPTPVMDMARSEYSRDDRRSSGGQHKRKVNLSEDDQDRRRGRENEDTKKQRSRSRPDSTGRTRRNTRDRERDRGGRSKSDNQSGEKRSRSSDRNYQFSSKFLKQFNNDQKRELEVQEEEAEKEEEEQYRIKYKQFLLQYDDDKRPNRVRPGSGQKNDKPSKTLYIKGIKEDMDEEDLRELFIEFPGIINCNIMKDKITGASRGFGFMDFSTVDEAKVALQGAQSKAGGFPSYLSIEFGLNCGADNSGGGSNVGVSTTGSVGAMDWLCGMCGAVNFSRRLECYQCCAKRQKDVLKVPADPEGPTSILRVSGIHPQVSKEDLVNVVSSLVDIKEVRLMKDKYTGYPRGFGFIHLYSVADAVRAINYLQGCDDDTLAHLGKLSFTYAKDKSSQKSDNLVANDALAAGQAMQNYSTWQPKEFQHQQQPLLTPNQEQPQPQQQQQQPPQQFVYDSNSGYWYDTVSGCYYDANTQLYYHPEQQQWLQYDYTTSTYVVVPAQQQQQVGEVQKLEDESVEEVEVAKQSTTSMITSSLNALKAFKQEVKNSQRKPAVIGAAPKLDPVALMRSKLLKEQNQKEELKEESSKQHVIDKNKGQKMMSEELQEKKDGRKNEVEIVSSQNAGVGVGSKRVVKGVIRSKSYVQNATNQAEFSFF